ncbi:MAG: SDR family oxidoreductase [Pseudobacteriovorax sp.]|nr:SDR family oxidoreductase [Pseudobacteriovorax sp.]
MSKKIAVVTGAGSGIGKAISLELCRSGYHVWLLGRNGARLDRQQEACEAVDGTASVLEFDLMAPETFSEKLKQMTASTPNISVLVNNAGTSGYGHILDVTEDKLSQCMHVNAVNLMLWTRTLAPIICESEDSAIINIASVASRISYSGGGAYAASKHAVLGFTGCLFEDLRSHGVKVSAIMPGFVNTEMVQLPELDRQKMISPEDIAEAVSYVLRSSPRVCPTEIKLMPQMSPYR